MFDKIKGWPGWTKGDRALLIFMSIMTGIFLPLSIGMFVTGFWAGGIFGSVVLIITTLIGFGELDASAYDTIARENRKEIREILERIEKREIERYRKWKLEG